MDKYNNRYSKGLKQHNFLFLICFSAVSLFYFSCSIKSKTQSSGEQRKFDLTAKWDTVRVLKNPHKGWYHHYYDNTHLAYKGKAIEAMPGLDLLFIRLAWSYFEPVEGNYDWHYIDDLVNEYRSKGLRFGFAFTCKETSKNGTPAPVGYATPKWVFDSGAKGKLVDC